MGCLKYILYWLLIFWLISFLFNNTDNTDKDFWHRSNLRLHIDNKTGCHYLSTWSGVMIPRLDKDGHHLCIGYEE